MWSKERGGRGKIFVFRIAKEEDAMEDFKLRISCKIRKEKKREREKKKKTICYYITSNRDLVLNIYIYREL